MKTKIRLTESELTELIKKVVKENETQKNKKHCTQPSHCNKGKGKKSNFVNDSLRLKISRHLATKKLGERVIIP